MFLRKLNVKGAEHPRILVVEDEFLIALSTQSTLEDAGFQILGPASSVKAALDLLDSERPSAAVLDINLRGEFVTPVARRLEALDVPFVLYSSYAEYAATLDKVFAGAPTLSKPVRDQQMVSAVTGIINSRSSSSIAKQRRKRPPGHRHQAFVA